MSNSLKCILGLKSIRTCLKCTLGNIVYTNHIDSVFFELFLLKYVKASLTKIKRDKTCNKKSITLSKYGNICLIIFDYQFMLMSS